MPTLRIVYMGTPDFAVPALEALHRAGHTIAAVYAQPPKPAGRGQQVQKSAVQKAAEALGLEVRTPKTLRDEAEQEYLRLLAPDVIIVAAYGLLLPQNVIDIPLLGCINIHASLLPRWRGAAPIQRAILEGDAETGITLMRLDAGLDTGPMLMKRSLPITASTTSSDLHDRLAGMGAAMIVPCMQALADGTLKEEEQPAIGITHAAKLTRTDGMVDWHNTAAFIERQVRALNPWPGTFFTLNDEKIKILAAEIVPNRKAEAGTLLDDQFTVACGKDAIRLLNLQRPGKTPADGASLLRGLRLPAGFVLP